jgi:hypothetical protein
MTGTRWLRQEHAKRTARKEKGFLGLFAEKQAQNTLASAYADVDTMVLQTYPFSLASLPDGFAHGVFVFFGNGVKGDFPALPGNQAVHKPVWQYP